MFWNDPNWQIDTKLVEKLGAGRHGDSGGLYPMVDPSDAQGWIVRVVVKSQKNKWGGPLRTDFGLGGADIVTLNHARERAIKYRRMANQSLNPRFKARHEVPTFEAVAQQVQIDRMPIDAIDQPEVMMCLSPVWIDKHETAKRLSQRIKTVLDVAKSKGFRSDENPVTGVKNAQALPKFKAKVKHN